MLRLGQRPFGPSLKQIIEIGARSDLRRTWLI
jgi:hypothetical protein